MSRALHQQQLHQPLRPTLQALHNALPPTNLSDVLDSLEEALTGFSMDFAQLAQRLSPVLHTTEAQPVQYEPMDDDDDLAPAVRRVEDAARHLRALHEQVYDIAARIAL